MANPGLAKRLGVTPIRAVLVAILAVVLVVVLVGQFSGGNGTTTPRRSPAGPLSKNTRTGPRSVTPTRSLPLKSAPLARPADRAVTTKPWVRIPVEEVCQFNPLKMPPALAASSVQKIQPEAEKAADDRRQQRKERRLERQTVMQSLQETGVGLVVASDRATYAIIGTQVVHVGDVIQGFVVKEIGPQGVVLADQQEE